MHQHTQLGVFVDGKQVPVPANIGVDQEDRLISPLHTHDDSGLVHIESAKRDRFTLGQLFTQWGVRMTDVCVGSYCEPDTPVRLYVDGVEEDGSPVDYVLGEEVEVTLVIGRPPAELRVEQDA